jgi:flagellar motor switch protein FliM
MADILSQEEVDVLLNAVSSGDVADTSSSKDNRRKEVNVYDFKRPEMISKDQIRTLQMVHENFARFFSNFLSAYLRTVVEVKLIAVDQLTYGEFIMSLPNPTNMSIISMEPLLGRSVFEINPILVFTIIDRLLGGEGTSPTQIRLFTEIEQKVIEDVVCRALKGLEQSWEHIIEINFELVDREMNPQFCQILATNETVASMTFEVKIAETTGILSICIPYLSLEPLIDKLSAQHLIGATQKRLTDDQKEAIVHSLKAASANLSFEIGRTSLSVRELLELQAGDVVVLDEPITALNTVNVEKVPKFKGIPGLVGTKKGFLVQEILDKT